MNRGILAAVLCSSGILVAAVVTRATPLSDAGKTAKHSIKEVMVLAHKGEGLLKKVTRGDATEEEKVLLLDLYLSLTDHKPPKGDQQSWRRMTDGLAIAAARVVVGRDEAIGQLKKATNCGACHQVHK